MVAAGLSSTIADGLEHYVLYVNNGYRWPSSLPRLGVAIAALVRACLTMGVVLILSEFVGAITTVSGAAVVGFALPQAVELFIGKLKGTGFVEASSGDVVPIALTTKESEVRQSTPKEAGGAV